MQFFSVIIGVLPVCNAFAAAQKCSQTNLVRCLDSGCAINIGMNPGARCQYCGTDSAGTPPKQKGLSNVTIGQSTKYSLTDKELNVAPSDPGKRYMWVTTECIKKVANCTAEDVSKAYDKLIEQSCKAAGVTMQTTRAMASLTQKPTKTNCTNQITTCVTKKCGEYFDNCADDSVFTNSFAECATDATGCDDYIKQLRETIANDRTKAATNRENALTELVAHYQSSRNDRLNNAISGCQNDNNKKECVDTLCENNMAGQCKENTEKQMAELVCGFYDRACNVLSTTTEIKVTKTTAQSAQKKPNQR